jgi:hypothetical protein
MDTHVLTPTQQQHALALEKQLQLQLAGGGLQSGRNMDLPAAGFTSPQSTGGSASSLALSPIHAPPSHPSLLLPSPSPASPQSILSPGPQSPTQTPLSYIESMLLLTRGEEMVKYAASSVLGSVFGRVSADTRYVFYEKSEGSMGHIYWCKPGMRTKDPNRCIPLAHVTELYEQAETGAFGSKLKPAERACCFSIVCGPRKLKDGTMSKGRTLDLQAKTVTIRDTWMHCIHQILIHSGYGVHEKTTDATAASSPQVGSKTAGKTPTSASAAAHAHATELNKDAEQEGRVGKPDQASASPPAARTQNHPHIEPANSPLGPTGSPQHVNWLASPIPNEAPLPLEDQVINANMKALHLQTSPQSQQQQQQQQPSVSPVIHAQNRSGLESVVSSPQPETDHDAKFPDAVVYEDPLIASKLILSMSPTSHEQLGVPRDSREIPAELTVPAGNPTQMLSPSERPTQTPMPSPMAPA